MVVIDQHALHERILYEQLRDKVLAGALESQRLLVPEPVDLAASGSGRGARASASCWPSSASRSSRSAARRCWSPATRRCSPTCGRPKCSASWSSNCSPAAKRPKRRDLLDELLHMIACKAAVKAGDRLTPEEIDALLEQRHWPRTTITARTAGPRRWSLPAKSSTGSSSGFDSQPCFERQ